MNSERMAEIHALCFSGAPRPWTSDEFDSLLKAPGSYLLTDTDSFALFRIAGPEAELLSIAVHPEQRRKRIAFNLIKTFHKTAKERGIEEIFLDVSVENTAAQKLYESCGYSVKATRNGYYIGPNGQKIDAIIMACTI